MHETEEQ